MASTIDVLQHFGTMDSILRQRQIFLEQLGYLILEYGLDQESLDTDFLGVQLLLISEGLGTVNLEALANDDILELNKVIEKLVSITKVRRHVSRTSGHF